MEFSRREFLMLPIAPAFVIACNEDETKQGKIDKVLSPTSRADVNETTTPISVENESNIPLVEINTDGTIYALISRSHLTSNIGIDRVLLQANYLSNMVYTLAEVSNYFKPNPNDPNSQRDVVGFIPYDEKIDIDKAVDILEERRKLARTIPFEGMSTALEKFNPYRWDLHAILTGHHMPELNTEQMLVFGEGTTSVRDEPTEAALLQLRLKFVKPSGPIFKQ